MLNTKPVVLLGGTIVTTEKEFENGFICIDQGTITDVGRKENLPYDVDRYEQMVIPDDRVIFPGFIDMHIHGANGADVMDATQEALSTIAGVLPAEGTTAFLATTITQEEAAISRALRAVARYMGDSAPQTGAEMLGIHLEGPFISARQAGAQPVDQIQKPDQSLFDRWQNEAEGHIRLVTMAPEEEGGLALVRHLSEQGVVVSAGHSDATFEVIQKAVQNGLRHATHLYNGMRGMHHREPGVVGSVFLTDSVLAEVIFDGVHVAEEMVQLAYDIKGSTKIAFITDAMRAKCLPNGKYDLGGQNVTVEGREARLDNGALAGSVLKMNEAVQKSRQLKSCSLIDIVRMSSANAAQQLGISHRKGDLCPGMDADIVILDADLHVQQTFCRGQLAYSAAAKR